MNYDDAASILVANDWYLHSVSPICRTDKVQLMFWRSPRLSPNYWEWSTTLFRPCNQHLATESQRALWARRCFEFNGDRIAQLPEHLIRDRDFLAALEMCPHA